MITEREQERLEALQESLDLEELQGKIDEAILANTESSSEDVIVDTELIANADMYFHWALRYCSSKQISPPGIILHKMPVYTEAYDLSTNFVYVSTQRSRFL